MVCPNCYEDLSEGMNLRIQFCPFCGKPLFNSGNRHFIQIQCQGQRVGTKAMLISMDDRYLYEVRPGENINLLVDSGFHNFRFKQGIRHKNITLPVTSGYTIKAYYNSMSGLIETSIGVTPNSENGLSKEEALAVKITSPIMVSDMDPRGFENLMKNDGPEYEFSSTSGFKEGTLKVFFERLEFSTNTDFKKDITKFRDIVSLKKKMGSIDIQCEGNVHKVYSIPKDIYNEVVAFLTKRIEESQKPTK